AMLIIPLTGKISWRNPPVITICIILINCMVFFFFQSGEKEIFYKAKEFYFESKLAEIEIQRYIEYAKQKPKDMPNLKEHKELDEEALVRYQIQMDKDYGFLKKLRNDEIITIEDPVYAKWKRLRNIYEDKLSKVVFIKYGFRPAYKSLTASFTYMFLHGSFGHLLGNMIFLWIVGCVLELGCGRILYTGIYLMGGLLAVGLFWLVYMQSTVPLVGASGAIAGLMGTFTILFGKKKVNIFYSLGFYFNYVKVPAIILLPIWIGNELYQLFFGGISQVAYVAHIGGLAGGAILGFISLKFPAILDENIFKEDPKDEVTPLIEEALQSISELDMEQGSKLLNQVLEKEPGNLTALTHLFNVEKHTPESDRFHKTAKQLLSLLIQSTEPPITIYNIYKEYINLSNRTRLSPKLYLSISTICIETGHFENAKRILTILLKNKPILPGISLTLLKLANGYRQKGMQNNCRKVLQVIRSKYPGTPEAKIAEKALKG
ncbi:MAG: rhomboid family intramembrane serine protease, partial [Deltaproteobacteria bacterium]|nr:rhomboid family intramembrane serine protease [Deltaproteobacteria bacterium]